MERRSAGRSIRNTVGGKEGEGIDNNNIAVLRSEGKREEEEQSRLLLLGRCKCSNDTKLRFFLSIEPVYQYIFGLSLQVPVAHQKYITKLSLSLLLRDAGREKALLTALSVYSQTYSKSGKHRKRQTRKQNDLVREREGGGKQ